MIDRVNFIKIPIHLFRIWLTCSLFKTHLLGSLLHKSRFCHITPILAERLRLYIRFPPEHWAIHTGERANVEYVTYLLTSHIQHRRGIHPRDQFCLTSTGHLLNKDLICCLLNNGVTRGWHVLRKPQQLVEVFSSITRCPLLTSTSMVSIVSLWSIVSWFAGVRFKLVRGLAVASCGTLMALACPGCLACG